MSLNIAPPMPHNIVNAAAPSTESLARANAIKEVVPAPVQVEAAVPQKSREQDSRGPALDNPTYDSIKQPSEKDVIPDDPLGEQSQEQGAREQAPEENSNDEAGAIKNSDESSDNTERESKEREIERAEREQREAELKEIQQLERRDDEVRAHEQAHAAVGGGHAGAPRYQYETGPDGQKYAVSGEVSIDVSKEATPQDTIQKMQTVRAAALAPAEPSSQDRKVAAEASQKILEARAELISENAQKPASNDKTGDDSGVELNTESPLAEEPRKRDLAGAGGDNQQNASSGGENESATLAYDDIQPEQIQSNKVIQSRYIQSYQTSSHNFTAVA